MTSLSNLSKGTCGGTVARAVQFTYNHKHSFFPANYLISGRSKIPEKFKLSQGIICSRQMIPHLSSILLASLQIILVYLMKNSSFRNFSVTKLYTTIYVPDMYNLYCQLVFIITDILFALYFQLGYNLWLLQCSVQCCACMCVWLNACMCVCVYVLNE